MAPDPTPIDPEDTNVLVMRMHKVKRKRSAVIGVGTAIFAALGVVWFLNAGKSCTDHLPLISLGEPAERLGPEHWIVNPGSATARVHLVLSEEAPVWLGDEELGTLEFSTLELQPGEHIIRAMFGKTEMRQLLTVAAGQEFRVAFNRDAKKINLLRVPAKSRKPAAP